MESFWDYHGMWFLIFMFFFPRLTMLFATTVTFGVLAWVGWFFVPRFVGAFYATVYYGDQNTFLCALAWIIAILGCLGEGGLVIKIKK